MWKLPSSSASLVCTPLRMAVRTDDGSTRSAERSWASIEGIGELPAMIADPGRRWWCAGMRMVAIVGASNGALGPRVSDWVAGNPFAPTGTWAKAAGTVTGASTGFAARPASTSATKVVRIEGHALVTTATTRGSGRYGCSKWRKASSPRNCAAVERGLGELALAQLAEHVVRGEGDRARRRSGDPEGRAPRQGGRGVLGERGSGDDEVPEARRGHGVRHRRGLRPGAVGGDGAGSRRDVRLGEHDGVERVLALDLRGEGPRPERPEVGADEGPAMRTCSGSPVSSSRAEIADLLEVDPTDLATVEPCTSSVTGTAGCAATARNVASARPRFAPARRRIHATRSGSEAVAA